jgi:hypothetical protein
MAIARDVAWATKGGSMYDDRMANEIEGENRRFEFVGQLVPCSGEI